MGFHSDIGVWFYTTPSNAPPSAALRAVEINELPECDPQPRMRSALQIFQAEGVTKQVPSSAWVKLRR